MTRTTFVECRCVFPDSLARWMKLTLFAEQEIIAANADLLERGGDRKARKKLFKAVEQGNFEDVDFDFEDDYALTAGRE